VLDGDTATPHGKGYSSPPLFGPCLLWPNGLMDQDDTSYGARRRPWRHCVRFGSSSPTRKRAQQPPAFLARVYCGQAAGWIRIPLCTKVGLGQGDIVPARPSDRGIAALYFSVHINFGQMDG